MVNHKCSIIADPDSPGWEFAEKIYHELRMKSDLFELNKINIKRFRDNEIKPKIELNVRERYCFFIHNSNSKPSDWFLELALINQALVNSSAYKVINVLPYLKFSRQDRKDESRVPISAKAIADVISLYANRVLTLDVHNLAIQGFYDTKVIFDSLYSFPTVINYLKKHHPEIINNLVIMSTDAGGAQRAKMFAKCLGIKDIAVGYKTREKTGEVEDLKILGDVKDKDVLIIDDIVDSGGTLIKAAEALRKEGANKVYVYATHGIFTKGYKEVTDCFDKLFIGDTIKQPEDINAEIISFIPLFAEAIYRISEGESLSELFKDGY
ncbi:ribose-phosphate diphosphokinase [Candidatus Pacearchaeota archaeon]|nr:ribose-phosphate diphosphokinase [Candidatus Pacearchaeota archaeon]